MSHEQLNLEVVDIVRNWDDLTKRSRYERRLQELGPVAIETLLVMVRQELWGRKFSTRFWRCLLLLFFAIFLTCVLLSLGNAYLSQILIAVQILICVLGFLDVFWNKGKATRVLAEFSDMRAVGLLIEAWRFPEVRMAISDALIRQLPQMKASDAYLLNADHRKVLYDALQSRNEPLILAILMALEQVDNGAALPFVDRLANPPAGEKVSAKVREAAQACMPYLIERAEQKHNSATLLRASGTMEAQPAELLRPATTTSDTDPRDLLRATQQE